MSEKSPPHHSAKDLHRLNRDVMQQTHNIFNWESNGQGRDDTLLRYVEWSDKASGAALRLDERDTPQAPFLLSVTQDSLHRSQANTEYFYGNSNQYAGKVSGSDERRSGGQVAREILDHLQTFQTLLTSERTDFEEFAAEQVALDMKRTLFVARALSVVPRIKHRYIHSAVATRAEREQLDPARVRHYLTMATTWQ